MRYLGVMLGSETAEATIARLQRELDEAVAERDLIRDELAAACIAESRMRTERDQIADEYQKQIDELTGSRAWRVVSRYRIVVNRMLPSGTRRRRIVAGAARRIVG